MTHISRPAPVVPVTDGLQGLAALTAAWLLVMLSKPHPVLGASFVLVATAAPMLFQELRRSRTYSPPAERSASLLPWAAAFLVAAAPFLWMHAQHSPLWIFAWAVAAPAFILRLALERLVRQQTSLAGFPATLANWRHGFSWPSFRLWSLKAFFIPLYGASLLGLVAVALSTDLSSPGGWLIQLVLFAYTVDLAFGLSGYVFASSRLAPTLRSTQPLLVGWIVCVLCYGPVFQFWPAFEGVVLNEIAWPRLEIDTLAEILGAALMLLLLPLYVSATVVFGLRFANLSNRGVITSGPYRLMKHPAYFAHVGNAWVIVLLLLPITMSTLTVLTAFTILYRLRSITEEMHMREEPDYRTYSHWIARNGILARLRGQGPSHSAQAPHTARSILHTRVFP